MYKAFITLFFPVLILLDFILWNVMMSPWYGTRTFQQCKADHIKMYKETFLTKG